jgi:sulfane dehydrogenase subunit SoxC
MSDESSRERGGIPRRKWLTTATAGVIAAGLVRTRFDALMAQQAPTPTPAPAGDPTKIPGRFGSEAGTRSQYEKLARLPNRQALSMSTRSPVHLLDGMITPSDLHFERHHGGIPDINPANHELLIHGMVDRPMVFKMADLRRYPAISRIHFLECSGNGGFARMPNEKQTLQQTDGLLSTSEWVGVPITTLFREVGVRPGATWVIAEGSDSAMMNRSIPMAKMMNDAFVAYGQNGEAIRPEQGYPMRLFLPGFEGNTNIKWLRRLEVTDRPVMSREETSAYTESIGKGKVRQFSFDMDAKSLITFPSYPYVLPDKGWWEIRGLAWSGRGKIVRVDFSTDGKTWIPTELQGPVLPKCTTRFRALWNWTGQETMLWSRAIDETGYVQPTLQEVLAVRGERTSYHSNYMRPMHVATGGDVTFGVGYTA